MTKLSVITATDRKLNLMVAIALGAKPVQQDPGGRWVVHWPPLTPDGQPKWSIWTPDYCGDWAIGGPIKEREGIAVRRHAGGIWYAMLSTDLGDGQRAPWSTYSWKGVPYNGKPRLVRFAGSTELEASMRCLVAGRLGLEVDIPEGLL